MRLNRCPYCRMEFDENCGNQRVEHIRTCKEADPHRTVG